jgi:hypothetical protein
VIRMGERQTCGQSNAEQHESHNEAVCRHEKT